jgi:acetyltransferase-like isoleucine patch superfamily enzyme
LGWQGERTDEGTGLVPKWLALPLHERLDVAMGLVRGWLRGWQFDEHGFLILSRGVRICKRNGRLRAGKVIRLRPDCRIAVAGNREAPAVLSIGNFTEIGDRTIINASIQVEIGARCSISWDCDICDSDFHRILLKEDVSSPPISEPVIIEDDVWIGARCMILKGVTIRQGSVIGAGSVVRRDVPPYSLMVGNPARRVGSIDGWTRGS